ncbi:ABC transporter [Aspergillus bombycis]|uniref:ABC transporter n=1 Tax=Aspergillus bombycis TaxID=109264 RepID=A0A1F7ZMP3_9EURO|nr:ABC transporter [Aspergillus bombycis]OGM40305.1 ABC transporter [Aspergillus bombycis]
MANLKLFFRQIWTLTLKNLLLVLVRPVFTTVLRALVLPVIFTAFISYARNLFIEPATYGIGDPAPLQPLSDTLHAITGGRDKLVFVHNGLLGGPIEKVIDSVTNSIQSNQDQVYPHLLSSENELQELCRTSLSGVSTCIAAAVFYSSPTEGPYGIWNYSIRTDAALGAGIHVDSHKNDQEIYLLPFQHSIDRAIAQANTSTDQNALPNEIMEYPFTSLTQEGRRDEIRVNYMGAVINIMAIAIFIGIVGVTYQLTGLVAMERELGMSQLIDCMMPNESRWQSQAARFIAAHLALDFVYGIGWIIMGAILKYGIYSRTSAGITIVYNILAGLALSSFSIFGASFFKRAQLSGISVVIACLLLGVIAQMVPARTNGAVVILGLLFPPMNYVYFHVFMARWERQDLATDLVHAAPENPWSLPGVVLWILLIIQILVYPLLAAMVERILYSTASKGRKATSTNTSTTALRLQDFTKSYQPGWFYRNIATRFGSTRQSVLAVNSLSMDVKKGQIMVLLGANGSGKSTTLDAIAGLTKISAGEINIDYGAEGGRFGLCPQKNVLWDTLTVKEHVKIFNRLKATEKVDTEHQLLGLLHDCDLDKKVGSYTRTLSGGQKRKVQLAMMFTGASSVCCVDEVSSGLDPISRRKIWDILLAERGSRTILLTTHFLDEADLLADHIAILSKGVLKAEGSSVELKHRLGSGYRIHVLNMPGAALGRVFNDIPQETHFEETVYTVQTSAEAASFISRLEQEGITEYRVSGPTIEDVFLKVAGELGSQKAQDTVVENTGAETQPSENQGKEDVHQELQLLTGQRISMALQAWYLFRKRATILRRNPLPYVAALLIPVIAAGLVTLFLKDVTLAGCSAGSTMRIPKPQSLQSLDDFQIVLGPSSRVSNATLESFVSSLYGSGQAITRAPESYFHVVDSLSEFEDYIKYNFHNVTPGGFYLGDASSSPTLAWKGDNGDFPLAAIIQNIFHRLLIDMPIDLQFQYFGIPLQPNAGKILQLIIYFGLAMSVYPALFALYPTVERLRNVRALHFSNGVRGASLWLAYVGFDFSIVIISSVLAIIIFRAVSDIWYNPGYIFVVFFLYGLCSTLLSYLVSLFSRSQLAAFAVAAGSQCILFLIYLIAYMCIQTYSPTDKAESYIDIAHFTIGLISPSGNLLRALFVSLNVFSILCRGTEVASYPGEITLYGGPILYLIVQSFVLFGLLLWFDGGSMLSLLRSKSKPNDEEEKSTLDKDISPEELQPTNASPDNGLRVRHLTKKFHKFTAVEDITFSVSKGEVFALLGPNGAGKTTTISLIRGDTPPSRNGGDIFVDNISVLRHRASARSHLGVCPQFDAMDQMTVLEHLTFYARIRGVPDVPHNVNEVIRAVGLTPFKHRMALTLSGGNKRKLSLGIALMGNPTVLLLDEPSSGMDAASKRVMWKTLAAVASGRSIVLTTHSMEEADALAHRAGIMAKRMLALGTTNSLRSNYGNRYHVHLVHRLAPHTSEEDMQRIRTWVGQNLLGAVIEEKTYHGQLRFTVPATGSGSTESDDYDGDTMPPSEVDMDTIKGGRNTGNNSIVKLFSYLEESKEELGVQFYSVSQTTLDQVFLTIVGQHNIAEEGSGQISSSKE